jgi:hypothetical protein
VTTHQADPAAASEPAACLHFHALFLDTQLDLVLSPGLGRRMRAAFARLVTGGGDGDGPSVQGGCGVTACVPEQAHVPEEEGQTRVPEEKGTTR